MKKKLLTISLAAGLILASCGAKTETPAQTAEPATSAAEPAATADESAASAAEEPTEHATAPQVEVGYEGMEPVYADSLNDGEYSIAVDSSSSMFKIAGCTLYVSGGELTADIVIDSKSYELLYMGTQEDAENAQRSDCIAYTENEQGQSVFTVPVQALDMETDCAALSAKKQEWYGRTLVFRADSLPDEAFAESRYTSADELELADGEYTIEVALDGGSGRASVQSPAKLTVADGSATAEIIWSSNKYDYMLVDGEKYLPVSTDEFSVFEIPVIGFDYRMPVSADTTAMSVPYEIEYTLYFDSSTITG